MPGKSLTFFNSLCGVFFGDACVCVLGWVGGWARVLVGFVGGPGSLKSQPLLQKWRGEFEVPTYFAKVETQYHLS